MRGAPDTQLAMLGSLSTKDLNPADHPIRRIGAVVVAVLAELNVFVNLRDVGPVDRASPNEVDVDGVDGRLRTGPTR